MAKRSDLSTGEAAARIQAALGLRSFSRQTLRRLIDEGEISAQWTRPDGATTDVNGHRLRGHRRIDPRSVDAYVARKLAEREAEQSPKES